MSKPRVVVVGSSNMDLVCQVPRLPRPGETVTGGTFVTVCGGKGANQAVAAARCGADVRFITRLGDDAHGNALRESLQGEGIAVHPNEPDPESPTGTALILVDAQGENAIAVAPGANHRLTPDDLERHTGDFTDAGVALFQMEVPADTVAAGLSLARRHGLKTVLNFAPAVEERAMIGPDVSLLVVNETEAGQLTGIQWQVDEQLDALLALGVGGVVLTLGDRGAAFVSPEHRGEVAGYAVEPVDTTGAGDTFCGALCAELARGAALAQAVRFACAAGALATTALGAQSAIPSEAATRRLMVGAAESP